MAQSLSASLEDYLEAIFHIVAQKRAAKPKDISKRMKVHNSSVTGALKLLAQKGLINYAPYDFVTLTQEGEALANDVVRRHESLRDFFQKVLAVDPTEAEEAACKMEHAVSKPILERFIDFTEYFEVCPLGGAKWSPKMGFHCGQGGMRENCERCISERLETIKAKGSKGPGGKKVMTVALTELKPGQKGTIRGIKARGTRNRRIVEMGVTRGSLIEVERVAPLGDPIEVKVKGYHLSLRNEDAEKIEVEPL